LAEKLLDHKAWWTPLADGKNGAALADG